MQRWRHIMREYNNFKAAVIQTNPVIGEKEENIKDAIGFIEEAATNNAKLVVLPELAESGYVFESREEALSLAEAVPSGDVVNRWERVAKELDIFISTGINEIEEGILYNSSILVGPDGYIGTYRKLHLWGDEKEIFKPGNLGIPVFTTPIGRIAMLNCYDIWFPEPWRIAALKGADLICINADWIHVDGQRKDYWPMANYLCMANAHSNAVYALASSRTGEERGSSFIGHSFITDPIGFPIGGPIDGSKVGIVYGDVDFSFLEKARIWGEVNEPFTDRRTDYYGAMLGTKEV